MVGAILFCILKAAAFDVGYMKVHWKLKRKLTKIFYAGGWAMPLLETYRAVEKSA